MNLMNLWNTHDTVLWVCGVSKINTIPVPVTLVTQSLWVYPYPCYILFTVLSILMGHLNTTPDSPVFLENLNHLSGLLTDFLTQFTNIALKIPHSSGPLTPLDSPILNWKSQPFERATQIYHLIHQYCTTNPTHFSGPLKHPLPDSPILHPKPSPFLWTT
jgi:hypothetical protein